MFFIINILFFLFYTILSTFPAEVSFHTAPDGNPADEVGMSIIDKLLVNVVQDLFALIFEPIINDVVPVDDIVFPLPAKIPLNGALTLFPIPPPINEQSPLAIFKYPPLTVE